MAENALIENISITISIIDTMFYRVLLLVTAITFPALFTYFIASFLMSTFDVNLWYPEQRFFTVVAYLLLISGVGKAYSDRGEQKSGSKNVNVVKEKVDELVR